mmetsp:Transcript_27455/g.60070  ORF Transcript_27455/g.60070 Transcript_27455/m.60070 type:complete len:581 (+) Transcript_27455:47-1789(+)
MPDGNAQDLDKLVNQAKKAVADDDSDNEDGDLFTYWVDWPSFNTCIGVVIGTNAVTIGLETDARSKGGEIAGHWYLIELLFVLIFMLELALRFYYHRWGYFTERTHRAWNIIDFVIVTLSVLDTLILVPAGLGGTLRMVSFLRVVRLMRLLRLIRLFKIFKELWLVASGLLHSMKTLLWICLLMFMICYMFAVLTTHVVGHNNELYDPYFLESYGWDHEVYFKTVMRSILAFTQILTLDDWSDGIVRHVVGRQPWMLPVFLLFIALTSFGILNIIIGVVVESTITTAERDETFARKKRERDRALVFSQLREIFEYADVDGSGTLTLEEVINSINKPEVFNKLKMIDFPVADPEHIFQLLDYNDSGELTIDEFITGCVRMKGSAKSKDLLVAQVALDCMRKHYDVFEQELRVFSERLKGLDHTARALIGHGEKVFLNPQEYRMRHPSEKANSPAPFTDDYVESAPWLHRGTATQESTNWGGLAGEPRVSRSDRAPRPALLDSVPPEALSDTVDAGRTTGTVGTMHALEEAKATPTPVRNSALEDRFPESNQTNMAIEDEMIQPGAVPVSGNDALALPSPRR